jgi:hypothetical protein
MYLFYNLQNGNIIRIFSLLDFREKTKKEKIHTEMIQSFSYYRSILSENNKLE